MGYLLKYATMTEAHKAQHPDWRITRPLDEVREQNRIMRLDRLHLILPIAQARGIEVTTLGNAGEPYPAPDYWRPRSTAGSGSEEKETTHTGKGKINNGIVPEDSTYVKLTAQNVEDLKNFWEEVRKQDQEKTVKTRKIKTKA